MYTDGADVIMGSPQESALQRLWSRRMTLTGGLEEPELGLLENLFPPAQDADTGPSKNITPANLHPPQDLEVHDVFKSACKPSSPSFVQRLIELDAALLGDIPARYVIPALARHEYPVVGLWVDSRVVPGFRYRVRPIQDSSMELETPAYLFGARALTLLSIGRGYAKRVTFEADNNSLNNNSNYFWSDSRPEGFAFEIEVVSVGDKFTMHDANHAAAGTLEVVGVGAAPQEEVQQVVLKDGGVEKTVRIQVLAKVEWFEGNQQAVVLPVSGLAVAVRSKSGRAADVIKVLHVAVGNHQRRGFTLTPGGLNKWRRTTVNGATIGDVPTRYTVTGLEEHELPVVGTYVDPRVVPGFHYKVRPAGNKRPLFGGKALRLVAVGPGYGKRLTFAPDEGRLNSPDNYLWSDTHPEGLGFEPRAVHEGMRFSVTSDDQKLGEASVFRADNTQKEEAQETIKGPNGTTIVKYIHVDVTCHLTLASTNESREPEAQVMRVSGTAVIAREPGHSVARLVRIERVGLDSQLNLLFVIQQTELVFYPL